MSSLSSPNYVSIILDDKFGLTIHVNIWAILLTLLISGLICLAYAYFQKKIFPDFEIDEAEFGLGDSKIKIRPNETDRTVAYKIWVELSTRKIGLPIDPDHDVIEEIYDSWYSFFGITRELVKDVPVRKIRQDSTEKIIRLSIEVLNSGLRPHLTKWQARFRRWYDRQLMQDPNADLHPQDIQKKFPDYDEMIADMLEINKKLMEYRKRMFVLVKGK